MEAMDPLHASPRLPPAPAATAPSGAHGPRPARGTTPGAPGTTRTTASPRSLLSDRSWRLLATLPPPEPIPAAAAHARYGARLRGAVAIEGPVRPLDLVA